MKTHQDSNIEISVIIPVYNAEKYVDRCVSCLISQQTQWEFELLFIDDGSNDKSLALLKEWEQRDFRIRVFSQSNKGVSAARNYLLQRAHGNFVVFIDVDDWVDVSYLDNMRSNVITSASGLIIAGCYREKLSGVVKDPEKPQIYYPQDFHKMINDRHLYRLGFPWGKIFNMQIIRENKMRFEEGVNYGEDLIFLFSYLQYAQYVKFIEYCGYYYNMTRQDSLVLHYYSFESEFRCYEYFKNAVLTIAEQYKINDEELRLTNTRLLYLALRAIKTLYRPEGNKSGKNKRLSLLNSYFSDSDRLFMESQTFWCHGIDKHICNLVGHGRFRLLDVLLSIFFHIRYSRIGKIYLALIR